MSTHQVTNQSPALPEYNVVLADPALREGIARWGQEQDRLELETLGALAGTDQARTWGDQADRNPPGAARVLAAGNPDRRGELPPRLASVA